MKWGYFYFVTCYTTVRESVPNLASHATSNVYTLDVSCMQSSKGAVEGFTSWLIPLIN